MAGLSLAHPWAFTFGILGNIISFMVYLAPLPTFLRVYRRKSTEGFQSIPYIVALFSAMLWIYYALIKTNDSLLITINLIGCVIESTYILLYFIYAPKKAKIFTAQMVALLNFAAFGLILLLTLKLSEGFDRVRIVGWICVAFSVAVSVAPLSIIRIVIRTRSVEYMPFSLSFFLTVSAVIWFFYGLLTKDKYVALPNILGFGFGLLQMALYMFYKHSKKAAAAAVAMIDSKAPEHVVTIVVVAPGSEVHPVDTSSQSTDADQSSTGGDDREAAAAAATTGAEEDCMVSVMMQPAAGQEEVQVHHIVV